MPDPPPSLDHLPWASLTLFDSEVVRVGITRIRPEHPQFTDPGPVDRHVFLVNGSSVWVDEDGLEPLLIDPSLVTFYRAGEVVRRRAHSRRGDHSQWFAVAPAVLERALAAVDPRLGDGERPFPGRTLAARPAHALLAARIVDHLLRGNGDPLLVEEGVARLLDALVLGIAERHGAGERDRSPEPRSPRTRRRQRDLVHDARALLLASFRERTSLASLASRLDCTEHHLARVFRRATGRTLHGYRHHLRMRAALEALRAEPGCDLATLALDLGFSSHAHLTSSFHDAFGLPPSGLRARGAPRWPDVSPEQDRESARRRPGRG